MSDKVLVVSSMAHNSKSGGAMVSKRNLQAIQSSFGVRNTEHFILLPYDKKNATGMYNLTKIFNLLNLRMNGITGGIENEIIKKVRSERFSLVFIDSSLNGMLVNRLKNETRAKVAVFFHNCEFSLIRQGILHGEIENLIRLIPAYINELLSARYADIKIVLNNRDKNLLTKIYHNDITAVIPVTLEDKKVQIIRRNVVTPLKLLFVGSNFFPNINGINWFIKNVLPYCNAILTFVGRDIEKATIEKSEKLTIIPNPDDLGEFYNEADLVVVPIFEGGGMKVKVAEALMYGKTVLASEEAINGYDDIPSVIRCVTASDFINEIKNFKFKCSYNEESRMAFETRYSNDYAVKKFCEILR